MVERRLGGKLSGKLLPYVPRGAQYDYQPPSVFARYKILTVVFVILLASMFGYWAVILRRPHPVMQPAQQAQPTQPAQPAQPGKEVQPQSDPVYIEPLAPK